MKTHVGKWMVKIICLLLVLCGLQVLSEKSIANAYTAHTADEAIAWASSKVGQSLEGDNYYGPNNSCAYQCVDFIICYYKYLGVTPSTGNGCDYATNALPPGWTRVKGGQPQKGDILVYSANNSNKAGHVAIYESGRSTYHQNFNNCRKVTHETYQYNKLSNEYWGYIRPDWTTAHNPTGVVDICQSNEQGKLTVRGWAFDEDIMSAQIEIHVYIGGEGREGHNLGPATGNRPDVDNVYHCGAFHGFDKTITTNKSGNQRVEIFAINVGGGSNTLIFSGTVNIVAETEKPKISNIRISNINEKGYTVSCDVSDNIGVTSVKFPTWRPGIENPVWYDGVKEYDNRWYFVFDKANIIDAKYVTHIYAYDAAGNVGAVACDEVTVMNDTEAPQITKLEVKEVSKNKIILHVEATDNNLLGAFTVLSNVMYSNNAVGKLVTEYDDDSDYIGKCNYSGNIELEGYSLSNVPVYLTVAVRDESGNVSAVKTISTKCMGEEDNYAEINLKQGESIKTSEIKKCFGCDLTSVEIWLNESEDAILELENPGTDDEAIVAKKSGSEYVYFVKYLSRQQVGAKINVTPKAEPTPTPGLTPTSNPDYTPSPSAEAASPTKSPVSSSTSVSKTTTRPSVKGYTSGYTEAKQYVVKRPRKVKLKKAKALGKRKVKITWKWLADQDGYQFQYAMNRSFSKKKRTLNENMVISDVTLKNLKKGKTYYFRVRAYNKDGYKKKYGKWSNVRKVKVK